MGIFDKIKSVLSSGPSVEELEEIPIMNEKWFFVQLTFPVFDSVISNLSGISLKGDPTRQELVMGWLLSEMGNMGSTKNLTCTIDEETEPSTAIIQFVDKTEEEKKVERIESRPVIGERERKFSPVELLKYQKNFVQLERKASTLFNLEQVQSTQDKLNFQFNEKGKPIVHRTDNFYHFFYPLEKRVELFSECREGAVKLEEKLLGQGLQEFVGFIMEKENYNPHMEKYCSEVRKILNEYNVDF